MKTPKTEKPSGRSPLRQTALPYLRPSSPVTKARAVGDSPTRILHFPTDAQERAVYVRPEGLKVSPFQWRVYDAIASIPCGRVTTYGELARLLESCPRAVGSALRRNPFAPLVPCHRIVQTDGFLGGFGGSWQKDGASDLQKKKRAILATENVFFDSRGYLRGGDAMIWRG